MLEAEEGVNRRLPAKFTSEDGGPSPPQDIHEMRARDVAGHLYTASLRGVMSDREIESCIEGLQAAGRAVDLARLKLEDAEKSADTKADSICRLIGDRNREAERAKVSVSLLVNRYLTTDVPVVPIMDALEELGYSIDRIDELSDNGIEGTIQYGAAPSWIVSELADVLQPWLETGAEMDTSLDLDDDDWGVYIDISSASTDNDDEDETIGIDYDGLGSLFG